MTKSGMMPKQGEIWLVPIPFTDLRSLKRRPALVVSGDTFNTSGRDVIVLAVTSNLASPLPGLDVDNADLVDGEIKARSRILPAKIYTLEKSILERYFCRITSGLLQRAFQGIDQALDRGVS